MDCQRCILREKCFNVVWGHGPVDSKFMFIGESPTDEDELMQKPFMSREGKLFRSLISHSSLHRESCYFTFATKCPPKAATSAEKKEATKACEYWLRKEIAQLKPKVVVTLGRMPTSLLLNLKSKDSMSQVIGIHHHVLSRNIDVFPWYSPSYILQHGKKCDMETKAFLNTVSEFANATDSSVVV